MHEYLVEAAKLIGIELPALEEASKISGRLLDQFKELLNKIFQLKNFCFSKRLILFFLDRLLEGSVLISRIVIILSCKMARHRTRLRY